MSSSSSTFGHNSKKTPHGSCASGCLGAIPRNSNFKKGGIHYPKVFRCALIVISNLKQT